LRGTLLLAWARYQSVGVGFRDRVMIDHHLSYGLAPRRDSKSACAPASRFPRENFYLCRVLRSFLADKSGMDWNRGIIITAGADFSIPIPAPARRERTTEFNDLRTHSQTFPNSISFIFNKSAPFSQKPACPAWDRIAENSFPCPT
jgi:hypothetical protein